MISRRAALVDTNVLLRIAQFDAQHDATLLAAVDAYSLRVPILCVTLQNIAEFWNVATRPSQKNGFGLSIKDVARQIDSITERFSLLPETTNTYVRWRSLVIEYNVTGVLVHDARLAAIMFEHSITDLLTLNAKDFVRFPFLTAIDPRETI